MDKVTNTDQVKKEAQELKTCNNKISKFQKNKLHPNNTKKEMERSINNKEDKTLKREDKTTRKVMEKTKIGKLMRV